MTSEDTCTKLITEDIFLDYLTELNNERINKKMAYLALFHHANKQINYRSPSDYLLEVLKKKWSLDKLDKDMIVMQHKFYYTLNNEDHKMQLSMVVKGDDSIQTAMSKTVGLPVFFACKLLLQDKISLKGVKIPIYKEIYKPILKGLSNEGISFFTS